MFEVDAAEYVHHWWSLAVKGVLAMLFGFLVIIWPDTTILLLVLLFGAFIFLSGIFALAGVLSGHVKSNQKWLVAVEGGIGLLIGFIVFFYPQISVAVLLFFVSLWAIIYGIVQIISAVNLRGEIEHEWLLGVSGGLSVALGVIFLAFPIAALGTIAFLLGMVAFVIGAVTLVFAIRLRGLEAYEESLAGEPQPG